MSLLQDPNTKNEYRNNEVCRKYLGSGGMFHFLPFGNSWYLCPLNQLKLKILHTFIGNGKVVMVQDRRANIFIFENRRLSNKIKEISFLNLKKPFKRSSMYFPKCVPSNIAYTWNLKKWYKRTDLQNRNSHRCRRQTGLSRGKAGYQLGGWD